MVTINSISNLENKRVKMAPFALRLVRLPGSAQTSPVSLVTCVTSDEVGLA